MLYTDSIKNAFKYENLDAVKLVIVRSLKFDIKGFTQNSTLSPSSNLFYWYVDKSKQGLWNKEAFAEYKSRFIEEMNRPLFKAELSRIEELLKDDKDVVLLCFCKDYDMCHRSIIAEYFGNKGFNISLK